MLQILKQKERSRLIEVLARTRYFTDEGARGRRVFIKQKAGLGRFITDSFELSGYPGTVAGDLIDRVETFGTLPERTAYHSLGALLDAILNLGDELNGQDASFIASLIVRYSLIKDPVYLKKLCAQYPEQPSFQIQQQQQPIQEDSSESALKRDQVFISYSHKDTKWLDKLQTMLKPMMRNNTISVWADTAIKPGSKWRDEIEKALASANVAVLMVSQNFLASDFITKHELPPLLNAAEQEGLKVIWVPVGYCLYEETEIEPYQAVHNPSQPLESLKGAKLNQALVKICQEIKAATTATT